jgi:ribosomal protein S18 acetylase RimI-like enzyme
MDIRRADKDDLVSLLPLVRAYHAFEGLDVSEEQRANALSQLLGSDYGVVWLGETEAGVVAYLALCFGFSIEAGGRDAFIDELFVVPDSRGRGLGGTLLQRAVEHAQLIDLKALYLIADQSNHAALELYRRQGFSSRDKYLFLDLQFR